MIILPDSIQELVGRKIERIFTSHPDLDQVVFDLETTSANRRTRYAYEINGRISRIQNLSNMVGYTVLEVRPLANERDGTNKFAIFTEAIGQFGILYFTPNFEEDDSFITEGGTTITYEWQPLSEDNLDFDFVTGTDEGPVPQLDPELGIVSYDSGMEDPLAPSSDAWWNIDIDEPGNHAFRITELSFNAAASGDTAQFQWASDSINFQLNESGVNNDFQPSPFEVIVEQTSEGGPYLSFEFTDYETSVAYAFLIEILVPVETPQDVDDLVQEDDSDCSCLMLESHYNDSEAELIDLSMSRQPPFNSAIQYIVQEDDVRFASVATEIVDICPCASDDEEEVPT